MNEQSILEIIQPMICDPVTLYRPHLSDTEDRYRSGEGFRGVSETNRRAGNPTRDEQVHSVTLLQFP